MRWRILFWAVALSVLAVLAEVSPRSDALPVLLAGGIANKGKPAPELALTDLRGKTHRLADHRGEVVLINFWATWCPPCRDEMPSMEALYQAYRDRGFVILAVNYKESPEQVRDFMQDFGLSFTALLDPDGKATRSYGIRGIPATFIVGPKGIVRHVRLGPADWTEPETKKLVEDLLKRSSSHMGNPPSKRT